MDRDCMNCGEPWDIYHIIHKEGLIEEIKKRKKLFSEGCYSLGIFIEADGFKIQKLCSWNEVPEGHFLIRKCPACK